jgi:hypothetical protein
MKIPMKYLLIAIAVFVLALFFGGWYWGAKRANDASEVVQTALKHELTSITVQLNDKEYSLIKAEQEIITQKELIKQGELSKKELKVLNIKQANEISKLKFQIDTLLKDVDHSGQIVIVHDTITKEPKNAMLLPFAFGKSDEWLDLKGRFDENGKLGIALKMNIAVDVISGYEKKTKTPTVNVLSDNPYLNTIAIRSYKTDTPKPKKFGLGVIGGYGIATKTGTFSPFVGVGASWTPIRF